MVSRGETVAYHLEFVKRAQQAVTKWPKAGVVLKCQKKTFCHERKLTPNKFQMRPFGQKKLLPTIMTKLKYTL
jgi:hypothetical protein